MIKGNFKFYVADVCVPQISEIPERALMKKINQRTINTLKIKAGGHLFSGAIRQGRYLCVKQKSTNREVTK